MEAKLTNKSPESIKTAALILPFTTESLKKLKPKTRLETVIKKVGDDFKGEKDQTLSLTGLDLNAKKVILCGLGAEKELNPERLRRCLSNAIRPLNVKDFIISLLNVNLPIKDKITGATETIVLSTYNFDKYKSKKDKKVPLKEVLLAIKEPMGKYQSLVKETKIICSNTNFVRDLVNENSEQTTTLTLTQKAKALASKYKSVRIRVLTETEIKRQKLNLIQAVGKGSRYPPRFVILEYRGDPRSKEKTAIVGKGITFDTGGINLKPYGSFLERMRNDMAGAGTTLGIIKAAAELKLKKNLIGAMPMVENMIGPKAYKPGDTFVSYSGKTVEVLNTDAEGRLILADAISYVIKNYKPTRLIDFATLTGAAVAAFHEYVAALLSNNTKLANQLQKSSKNTGEQIWEMPLYEEYRELMKSDIGDVRNISKERFGGLITAAVFLENFIEDTPWAHIDIAPTAWSSKGFYYNKIGATGFGVRLVIDYLKK